MSDVLSYSRLLLLVKNNLVENRQRYLLYALGMLSIGLIIFVLTFSVDSFHAHYDTIGEDGSIEDTATTSWEVLQVVFYYGGLYVFGAIFACISFVNFSNSAEAIFYLNKPASYIEKWLTEIIVHVFLFFLVYTLLFYLLAIPATFMVRNMEYADSFLNKPALVEGQTHLIQVFHPSRLFFFFVYDVKDVIVYSLIASSYISVVAFFMYGAVLFNRFSFFKTLLLGFVVGMVYFFYGLFFLNSDAFMPTDWTYHFPASAHKDTLISMGTYFKIDENAGFSAELNSSLTVFVSYALLIIVPAVLLACSCLKLKEKEV